MAETWGLWLYTLGDLPLDLWLAYYDPDLSEAEARQHTARGFTGPLGGLIVGTADPAWAKVFPSALAALDEWNRTSATQPVRPDGQPNKPLTAFSCAPRPLSGGETETTATVDERDRPSAADMLGILKAWK